jgi:BrnA antitoxin of type II toxin-antitoxin system
MKAEYDFSRGKRGAVLSNHGKTRITICLDDEIVKAYKAESERTGKGYQTLINESLAQHIGIAETPITAAQFREILREELAFPKKTSLGSSAAASGDSADLEVRESAAPKYKPASRRKSSGSRK